ncbi:MAG: MetQ/NlpA family ABC transporter substrate-binding protein [Pilosibacter sp.]
MAAGYTDKERHQAENPLNLDIKEVEAANTASLLPDVAAAVINGGHAVDNGLTRRKMRSSLRAWKRDLTTRSQHHRCKNS